MLDRVLLLSVLAPTCWSFVANGRTVSKRSTFLPSLGVTLDETFTTPDMSTILEPACRETASRMQRALVPVSEEISPSGNVGISFVHWPAEGKKKSNVPLFLVHGFDSSCLEYRRLGSRLAAKGIDTYAVDLMGWGFTQIEGISSFSADSKIEALQSFISELTNGGPYFIAGASLGGASAIELASANSDLCQGLILIDAQGFVDGVGPMASLPRPLAELGVQVLKSKPLRSMANQMSYFDKETFATDDAARVGRLHCLQDGWSDALVSFMLSGGFSPSEKVKSVQANTLVIWGRQDKILEGDEFANKVRFEIHSLLTNLSHANVFLSLSKLFQAGNFNGLKNVGTSRT